MVYSRLKKLILTKCINFQHKDIFVFLMIKHTSLSSISLLFFLNQTIHQIYSISHLFLSSHTLSYLLLSSQLLFQTKHTLSDNSYFLNLLKDGHSLTELIYKVKTETETGQSTLINKCSKNVILQIYIMTLLLLMKYGHSSD